MLHCGGFFEVLAKLLELYCVLSSQLLHLGDGLTLVHDKLLVPHGREILKLRSVLLLNLYLFTRMLIYKGNLEAGLCLLSNLYNLGELVLSRSKVTVPLIYHALGVQCLAKIVKEENKLNSDD